MNYVSAAGALDVSYPDLSRALGVEPQAGQPGRKQPPQGRGGRCGPPP